MCTTGEVTTPDKSRTSLQIPQRRLPSDERTPTHTRLGFTSGHTDSRRRMVPIFFDTEQADKATHTEISSQEGQTTKHLDDEGGHSEAQEEATSMETLSPIR